MTARPRTTLGPAPLEHPRVGFDCGSCEGTGIARTMGATFPCACRPHDPASTVVGVASFSGGHLP